MRGYLLDTYVVAEALRWSLRRQRVGAWASRLATSATSRTSTSTRSIRGRSP